ncbi:uncharacterized protein BJ171DRAFT_504957 [Polychytrium aggregatum]|uniref:uncharacterized protein n=1 Tax=Polychytrium aggregatum TaxID=110093 RepID=UPI0022FDF016|nr:uncharacterized protein BJ171DRAFT_504957 [Polychytrium aggregatum]KAI9204643.1 hypothetical protein BJ171DRAFT_504957 [Polychytrium aggregatum]
MNLELGTAMDGPSAVLHRQSRLRYCLGQWKPRATLSCLFACTVGFLLLGLITLSPIPTLAHAGSQFQPRLSSRLTSKQLAAVVVDYHLESSLSLDFLKAGGTAESHLDSSLAPFLTPRVSGTPENKKVQEYIIQTFRGLGWDVETDSFNASTPYGHKSFTNIVVTQNPRALSRLVLAAHFDSKYFKDFDFVGATDSSVPCAILVDIAKTLDPLLHELDDHLSRADQETQNDMPSLQFVFFDGEEAFKDWTATDSLYGSRHLASKWEQEYFVGAGGSSYSTLSRIELFVLLDLLGAPEPTIFNTNGQTAWAFERLVDIQKRLIAEGHASNKLVTQAKRNGHGYFMSGMKHWQSRNSIQDDHLPFQTRGVSIVHLITQPFPPGWHTVHDDAKHLDADVILDFARIFRVFVAEYIGLTGH